MAFPFIDVHTHFVPPFYREALKEAGYLDSQANISDICPDWSVESHLAFMRANNVRKSYLSLSAPGTFLHAPAAADDTTAVTAAKTLTRRVNEYAASIRQAHPGKFGFFASLPLPDVQASLDEIAYLTEHSPPDGFTLLSNTQGVYIGDPCLSAVYEKLDALKAIVFIHPAGTSSKNPTGPTTSPSDSAKLQSSLPKLDFAFDSTHAFARILLTNTPALYPHIKWIIPHCAFALPSILPRILSHSQQHQHSEQQQQETQHEQDQNQQDQLTQASLQKTLKSSFYFDLAGLPMTHQITAVLQWIDLTRFVFGSDVPFTQWRLAGSLGEQVRDELLRIFGMETGVHECMRICHGNAEALFGV